MAFACACLLAGCSTGGLSLDGPNSAAATAPPATPKSPPRAKTTVALAPIVGTPATPTKDPILNSQIVPQLKSAAATQGILLVSDAKADLTVRGYVMAQPQKSGAKIYHVWDFTDRSGQRVHRFEAEEITTEAIQPGDPWHAVSPTVTSSIVTKVMAQLQQAVAARPSASGSMAAGAKSQTEPAGGPSGSPSESPRFVVAGVSGAPGDGNAALNVALRKALERQGFTASDKSTGAYRIEGKVAMGQASGSKQPIRIDWRLVDPKGKSLGEVVQENAVAPGTLDGTWGTTADQAAGAAAKEIGDLLRTSDTQSPGRRS